MNVFVAFMEVVASGVSQVLNAFFSITYCGINFGALFLIGFILSFVLWLVWG